MKVRWTRDSLRLRITPTELEQIVRQEPVTAGLGFPGGHVWDIQIRPSETETMLASDEQHVFLSLSAPDRERLAQPENEGVYFQYDGPQPLRYYVEKDYPCVHPRAGEAGETPTETFEFPTETPGE